MDVHELRRSLAPDRPPARASEPLQALWHDAKGNWERAHVLAQALDDADGAWVHAYLHRKEGDLPNADYWYRRAKRKRPQAALESEWEEIAAALLAKQTA